MGNRKEKQKITLEALLELKRHERPGDEFWDSFESDFHRRRLNTLYVQSSSHDARWMPSLKAFAFGVPVVMLLGLGVFWSGLQEPVQPQLELTRTAPALRVEPGAETGADHGLRDEIQPAFSTDLASSQFVVDAIHDDSGPSMSFRKVLYTPAIHLSVPSGASYVRDNFSASNYQVTTADLKLGRNF
jgi:hypothetical protein